MPAKDKLRDDPIVEALLDIRFAAAAELEEVVVGRLPDIAGWRPLAKTRLPAASIPEPLEYGAVLYLNRITAIHIRAFDEAGVQCLGAVSATGLREIDAALGNLLMRAKADRLWGMD